MTPASDPVVGAARRVYGALLSIHAAARDGDAPAMLATFEALLTAAAPHGPVAIARLLLRETTDLVRHRRALPTSAPLETRSSTMRDTVQDIRFAWRTFRRRPIFTTALVATLALGIGANTAIFSVSSAVLLHRLPFPNPDRLVAVWEDATAIGFPRNTPAPGNYADWTTSIPAFAGIGALSRTDFNLTGEGEPEKLGGAAITASLWKVLDVAPEAGRVWRSDEDIPGNRVVVITHGLWQRRFAGEASVIGRAVNFNGSPYTILGVLPPRFELVDPDIEVFSPLALTAAQLQNRGSHYLQVIARLSDQTTLEQANEQLRALAARLARDHSDTNERIGMFAVGLLDDYVGDTRTALLVLLGAVGCVLLIACANVAGLLVTQAASRAGEMSVRAALGAGRRRLVRQLLTESLLLALVAGVAGTLLATLTFPVLDTLVPRALIGGSAVSLDVRVLAVTAGLTMLTGLAFGMFPAFRASRVGLAAGTRLGSRGVVGGGARVRGALVVGEIALACVLLVGAGLFVASLRSVHAVELGFVPDRVLTVRTQLPRRAYATPESRTQFVEAVLSRVRTLPGVESAGFTSGLPLVWRGGTGGFIPEGVPVDRSKPYDANNRVVSPGYMETMGQTLVRGRFFDASDHAGGQPVAIINETMARLYWPGLDPVGRRLQLNPTAPLRTIVGLVADTRTMGIERPTRSEMYFPVAQASDNWMWPRDLAIRVAGDPLALANAVAREVWAVDPVQPVSNVVSMDELVARERQDRTTQTTLLSAVAALALLLASIGVYGVLSQIVAERTPEIGLRLALGDSPQRISLRFVVQGLRLGVLGLAIGLVGAWFGAAVVAQLLHGVDAREPGILAGQAAVLLIVCIIAASLPALRASRVDPISAIRD